ncbi:MAG: hypothetical protein KAJ40_07795, partial [Alphaproteobacteria bacterium]|nr:hypothetical protein [Alphaproteobacteria bacterium]
PYYQQGNTKTSQISEPKKKQQVKTEEIIAAVEGEIDNPTIVFVPVSESTTKQKRDAKWVEYVQKEKAAKEKRAEEKRAEEKKKAEKEKAEKEKAEKEKYPPSVKQAIEDKHHVVSLRDTEGLSMAAYIKNNSLWMIVIGGSKFSYPSFLSPTPELFSKIQHVQEGDFDVYRLGFPENYGEFYIKVIGGALAWDIIIGDKVRYTKPVEPVFDVKTTNEVRGGKIIWPFDLIGDIVELQEPDTGKTLIVVTVDNATQMSGHERYFVDFDVLFSSIGMIIRPKVDDLIVKKTLEGVEISRPDPGLTVGLPRNIEAIDLYNAGKEERERLEKEEEKKKNLLFRFNDWQLGDSEKLCRYEMVLLSAIHGQSKDRLVQELLKLGKMFLAHGHAAEALGYFDYASQLLPALGASTEFWALKGAAAALDWKNEEALKAFSHKGLEKNDEIKLWQSFVLAALEDWQQAAQMLPEDYIPLYTYPDNIALRMALVLAEVNLRDGKVEQAEDLLRHIETKLDKLNDPMRSALEYLQGEAARQRGKIEDTKYLWEELTQDKDDLYRTKAGLALTMLLSQKGEITNYETIDRLERLRYAWRGDGLEAQVNYWLGDAYFKDKKFIKGLSIMREAAIIARDTAVISERIADDMARTFTNMYMSDELENVSALDSMAVYDQFKELTPIGDDGDKLVQRLAEHLVKNDLLGKAGDLLRYQVDHRLKGKEKLRIAIRLAAIELLDKSPQKALNALGKASKTLKRISDKKERRKRQREIDLLKIRSYSQNGEYNKALSLIEKIPMDKMVNRLRADISWQASYWDIAASSLKEVLIDENIKQEDNLTSQQVDLILNRAIALNLEDNHIELANMREKYSEKMFVANKDKARQFELITRKQHIAALEDYDALMAAVSEVDLFQGFLESYRNLQSE